MSSFPSHALCSVEGRFSNSVVTITATLALLASATILVLMKFTSRPSQPRILRSPLRTLIPTLERDELANLDYAPDEFPGPRDIPTPYGSMRVYEWGPESGPKVLLIHGISTSCQTLGPLAHALVRRRGCRVMLFDLYGRGFSDTPADLPHDARLYVTQALLAMASSPLRWTTTADATDAASASASAPPPLTVVGYSMGGGVAVHLAASLPPRLTINLVLLAPSGLIRPEKFGALNRFVFTAGLVPERLLAAITRRKLEKPLAAGVKPPGGEKRKDGSSSEISHKALQGDDSSNSGDKREGVKAQEQQQQQRQQRQQGREWGFKDKGEEEEQATERSRTDDDDDDLAGAGAGTSPVDAAIAEVADPTADTPLERRVLRYVQWMAGHHPGFLPSFMSCIRHAPLTGQHNAYAALAAPGAAARTAFILGAADAVVDPAEYAADAIPLVGGREKVFWRVIPGGGHDFPMTCHEETFEAVEEFLG